MQNHQGWIFFSSSIQTVSMMVSPEEKATFIDIVACKMKNVVSNVYSSEKENSPDIKSKKRVKKIVHYNYYKLINPVDLLVFLSHPFRSKQTLPRTVFVTNRVLTQG